MKPLPRTFLCHAVMIPGNQRKAYTRAGREQVTDLPEHLLIRWVVKQVPGNQHQVCVHICCVMNRFLKRLPDLPAPLATPLRLSVRGAAQMHIRHMNKAHTDLPPFY